MRKLLLVLLIFACGLIFNGGLVAQEAEETDLVQAFSYQRADGNRFVAGSGNFPVVQSVDVRLPDAPVWVVGAVAGDDLLRWYVATAIGEVYSVDMAFDGTVGAAQPAALLEPETPPFIRVAQTVDSLDFLGVLPDASPLTHPVIVGENWLYIANNGDVVLVNALEEVARITPGALPDGRFALSGDGRAAFYAAATDERYAHGIMGDVVEGAALMVIDETTLETLLRVDLDGDAVFEGLQPMWADVDGDEALDLIVTVSTPQDGAQIRVYRADGPLLASGRAIGQGNRWRHQLAWGAFGPSGEHELVEVLTPHLGGIVGYYRYDGVDGLEIVMQESGYTSHVIGSRNLDMALGGDFDGNGQPEIVLTDQQQSRIVGLTHLGTGVVESWSLLLNGTLTSNLAALPLSDETLVLAAGVSAPDGNFLRIWRG